VPIAETVVVETYEEWRLIFEVGETNELREIIEEALAETSDDVDIHSRGTEILVYAHTEEGIRAAGRSLSRLLALRGISVGSTLTRWNPGGERWQDPALPVEPPKRVIGWDWAELGELGWEVRVRTQSRDEAERLVKQLQSDGRPATSDSFKRLMAGVRDEGEARALAEELRLEAPLATIVVRPLSRWRRWLIRQRLLGNYAGGEGADGGNGGGGNGGGGG
jgi:hypothetical protein